MVKKETMIIECLTEKDQQASRDLAGCYERMQTDISASINGEDPRSPRAVIVAAFKIASWHGRQLMDSGNCDIAIMVKNRFAARDNSSLATRQKEKLSKVLVEFKRSQDIASPIHNLK